MKILNRYTSQVLLDVEGELRDANLRGANLRGANLYGANLRGADLRDADLRGANLRGANLRGADLRGANLRGANLRGANLRGANLRGANLYGADLRGANLYGADLRGADLRGAIGNSREVFTMQLNSYIIVTWLDQLAIGCQCHTIEEWKAFNEVKIAEMDTNSLAWWTIHKELVLNFVELTAGVKK